MTVHETYMREAIRLAEESLDEGGGPFGAVIIKDGEIIGRGKNRVTLINDPTAHAEIEAIRDACQQLHSFNLDGCQIYVNCQPCPMCLSALFWARIDGVYFAAADSDAAKAGFDDEKLSLEIKEGQLLPSLFKQQLLREEAIATFERWRQMENRTPY